MDGCGTVCVFPQVPARLLRAGGAVTWLQRQSESLWEDVRNPRLAAGKEFLGRREALPLEVCKQRLDSYVSTGLSAPTESDPELGPVAECNIVPTLEGQGREQTMLVVPVFLSQLRYQLLRSKPATYVPREGTEHPISFASN